MIRQQNIFLVGPMGAGKTTIGRCLAKELEYTFYDSDKEIEVRTGADIPWIFDVEGETGFRHREEQVIADLTGLQNIVLATGGGSVLSSHNRSLLAARGFVVYLMVSIDKQLARVMHGKDRPLLEDKVNLRKTLEALHGQRYPLYTEIADCIIQTDDLTPRIIARQIVDKLEQPLTHSDDETYD